MLAIICSQILLVGVLGTWLHTRENCRALFSFGRHARANHYLGCPARQSNRSHPRWIKTYIRYIQRHNIVLLKYQLP